MTAKADNAARFGVPDDSMVFARGVRKSFGPLDVLKGIDLDVPAGTVACIIGPSGSGKSTFLRCINHLEQLTGGILLVDGDFVGYDLRGHRLYEVRNDRLCQRRADIGMVFQSLNLFSHMTVIENLIEAPIHVRGIAATDATAVAETLLNRVGLADKRNSYPRELSGGQQQRVAIARALAMKPKVLLFDEPTSALDPELVGEVLAVIKQLAEDGMTMVLVTHEMGFARNCADTIVFMHQGRIWEQGPPDQVFGHPNTAELSAFIDSILSVNQLGERRAG